jgi:hypothetical protein
MTHLRSIRAMESLIISCHGNLNSFTPWKPYLFHSGHGKLNLFPQWKSEFIHAMESLVNLRHGKLYKLNPRKAEFRKKLSNFH